MTLPDRTAIATAGEKHHRQGISNYYTTSPLRFLIAHPLFAIREKYKEPLLREALRIQQTGIQLSR